MVVTFDEIWRFINKKTEKVWIWRAYDPINRRSLAWALGGGDDETCRKL
ncbi:hypothetical protein CCP2SC5_180007 [Azospirillaceae bacterium]